MRLGRGVVACGVQVVVMDLEDSVAIGEKEVARKNVIQALKDRRFAVAPEIWHATALSRPT